MAQGKQCLLTSSCKRSPTGCLDIILGTQSSSLTSWQTWRRTPGIAAVDASMASAMCTARRARHTGALVSRTATSQRVQGLTITTKISRNNGTGRTVAERPKGNGRAISIGLTTEARVRDAVQKEEKAKGTREQIPMLHQPFRHGPRKTQVPQLFNKHLCHPLPVHFHMQSF